MNKKSTNPPEGFTTKKIPQIDSEAPLVIDLPDGQKLIVGNIPTGTIIEVATWRGTGRPDSRTTRMMLGVSGAEDDQSTERDQESSKPDSAETKLTTKNIQNIKELNFKKS